MRLRVKDEVESLVALHRRGNEDCHFRAVGTAHGYKFLVNVQFSAVQDGTDERMRPEEFDFMICKILLMVLTHATKHPIPELH